MEIEEEVCLSIEVIRRAEEEEKYAWLKAEEEARLIEEERINLRKRRRIYG